MTIIGTWKIKKVQVMQSDFSMKMCTFDEIRATVPEEMQAEYLKMESTEIDFLPDGTVNTISYIPKEQIEMAKAEGMEVTEDGRCVVESKAWKEENGEFFYFTGDEGEIMGEKISPYQKLEFNEDGYMKFVGGFMLLEKKS